MDARDLFAMIGRLYAANVELTEEGERLKVQLKMAADKKKAMAEEIDLRKKENELVLKRNEGLLSEVADKDDEISSSKELTNDLSKACDVLEKHNDSLRMKCNDLEQQNAELKKINAEYMDATDDLKNYIKTLEAAKVVDARREEDQLKKDAFFD